MLASIGDILLGIGVAVVGFLVVAVVCVVVLRVLSIVLPEGKDAADAADPSAGEQPAPDEPPG